MKGFAQDLVTSNIFWHGKSLKCVENKRNTAGVNEIFNRHLKGFKDEKKIYIPCWKFQSLDSVRWEACYRRKRWRKNVETRDMSGTRIIKEDVDRTFFKSSPLSVHPLAPFSCKTEIGYRSLVIQIEFSLPPLEKASVTRIWKTKHLGFWIYYFLNLKKKKNDKEIKERKNNICIHFVLLQFA